MWQTGTSTDYLDLLDQLKEVATSTHIATVAVNAGGTGYTVDDILTVVGGTKTHTATIRVTSVAGGVVDGVRMETGGAYTSNPSLSANAVTGGTGSSATMDLTAVSTGWTKKQSSTEAVSAAIGTGGTGYTVGDDLTIVGGVGVNVAAVFNVDTESGGVVTAVSLVTAGDYEADPSNDAATTGGTGTGCELTVTWQDSTGTTERTLILEGNGGASETILVGIKTFQTPDVTTFDTCYNWALVGFTAFSATLEFHDQVGMSPGISNVDGTIETSGGAYMPLKDSDAFDIEFWFNFTNRRLIVVTKVEDAVVAHYPSCYMGYKNQFGTATEFPYPIYISGGSARENTLYTDTEPRMTGISECVGINGKVGPAFFLKTNGTWQQVKNSLAVDSGSPSRSAQQDYTVYPGALPNTTGLATADQIIGLSPPLDWVDIIPNSGIPGTPTYKLEDTPNTGDDLKLMVPCTVIASDDPDFEILGEIDDVFWFSGVNSVTAEDTLTVGSDLYRVFPNGNREEEFSLMAIKETY